MSANYIRKPFIVFDYNETNKIAKELLFDNTTNILYSIDYKMNEHEVGLNYVKNNTLERINMILDGVSTSKNSYNKIYNIIKDLNTWIHDTDAEPSINTIPDLLELFSNMNTTSTIKNMINNKVDKEEGKVLSANNYTHILKHKLSTIEYGANNFSHNDTQLCSYKNPVNSVNGETGHVFLDKDDFGLGLVEDNANLYIHPTTKQCKIDSVESINTYTNTVILDKSDIQLSNVENIDLSGINDAELDYYTIPYIVKQELDKLVTVKSIENPTVSVKQKLQIKSNMSNNTIIFNNGYSYTTKTIDDTIDMYPTKYSFRVTNNKTGTFSSNGVVDLSCGFRTIYIYIDSTYSLNINVDVSGVNIKITNVTTNDIYKGNRNQVREGIYVYEITKDHYDTVTGTVEIRSDKTIDISMNRTKYKLNIITTPITAVVTVLINGVNKVGNTFIDLYNGDYKILVKNDRYYDKSITHILTEDTTINIDLVQHERSNLTITSSPSDAECIITSDQYSGTVTLPFTIPSIYRYTNFKFIISKDKYTTRSIDYTFDKTINHTIFYELSPSVNIQVYTTFKHTVPCYIIRDGSSEKLFCNISSAIPKTFNNLPKGVYKLYYDDKYITSVSTSSNSILYKLFLPAQGDAMLYISTNPADMKVILYNSTGSYISESTVSGTKSFKCKYLTGYKYKGVCSNGANSTDTYTITELLAASTYTAVSISSCATLSKIVYNVSDIPTYVSALYTFTENGMIIPESNITRNYANKTITVTINTDVAKTIRCTVGAQPGACGYGYNSTSKIYTTVLGKYEKVEKSVKVYNVCELIPPPVSNTGKLYIVSVPYVRIVIEGEYDTYNSSGSSSSTTVFEVVSRRSYKYSIYCQNDWDYKRGIVYVGPEGETVYAYPDCGGGNNTPEDKYSTLIVNTDPRDAIAYIEPESGRAEYKRGNGSKSFTVTQGERYSYWAECDNGTAGRSSSIRISSSREEVDAYVKCTSDSGSPVETVFTLTIECGGMYMGYWLQDITNINHYQHTTSGRRYTARVFGGHDIEVTLYLDGLGEGNNPRGPKKRFIMPMRDYTIYM